MLSSNELSISKSADYCVSVTTCDDYLNKGECESDASLCGIAYDSSLPEVNCNSDSIFCSCTWSDSTNTCQFGWAEIEDCGTPETGCKYGCTLCKNETGNYCNIGASCPSGENPLSNNNGTCDIGEGCLSADCLDGDTDTCVYGTYCLSNKCGSVESPLVLGLLGNCQITQTIEKGCDEEPVGYKIISWTGIWTGEASGISYEKCIAGGRTTIPCAAQVQLPFFDYLQLILAVVIIAIIYFVLIRKKKQKHGKKRK
jgi:hypothetical protein